MFFLKYKIRNFSGFVSTWFNNCDNTCHFCMPYDQPTITWKNFAGQSRQSNVYDHFQLTKEISSSGCTILLVAPVLGTVAGLDTETPGFSKTFSKTVSIRS